MKRYSYFILFIFICIGKSNAQNWDIELLRNINLERNTNQDDFFKGTSNTATPVNIGLPIMLYTIGAIKKNKDEKSKSLYIAGSTLSALVIANGMKTFIQRPRPYVTYPDIDNVVIKSSTSFPSSHTSSTFALATSFSLSYPKWYVVAPSFLWAGTVSYSRIHLGVHYPTDVLGGMVIGSGSAWLCHYLNKKWFAKKTLINN